MRDEEKNLVKPEEDQDVYTALFVPDHGENTGTTFLDSPKSPSIQWNIKTK